MGASARGCAGVEAGPALQRVKKGQGGSNVDPGKKEEKNLLKE